MHRKFSQNCSGKTNKVTTTTRVGNKVTSTPVGKKKLTSQQGDRGCSSAIVGEQAMIPSTIEPSNHRQPTDHPIPLLLDLCLYRVVNDRCGGQVLPFGVRQIIKEYAWVSFDNKTLREAVRLWCRNKETALVRYGDINDWDVSQVTNMIALFRGTNFNDRIDRWDVRNVTTMDMMLYYTMQYHQPLDASAVDTGKPVK